MRTDSAVKTGRLEPSPQRRGATAAAAATAVIVSALLLSACSGKNPSPTSATTSASASNSGGAGPAAFQAYADCLRQHGVSIPSFSTRPRPSGSFSRPSGSFSRPPGTFSRPPGGFRGGGFAGLGPDASADPSTRAALQACASLRPQNGFGQRRGGPSISATTFAAFKSCMSDNGVTITQIDPQMALRQLNRNDPKTAAALKICQPILGSFSATTPSPNPTPSAGG